MIDQVDVHSVWSHSSRFTPGLYRTTCVVGRAVAIRCVAVQISIRGFGSDFFSLIARLIRTSAIKIIRCVQTRSEIRI